MTLRLLLIAAGALAAVLLAVPAWAEAILRPAATVSDDTIRLGDLFDGIGDKAGIAVARSPAPGRKAVVDADWLHRVATLNGVDWHSDDPFLQLVIDRPGIVIGRDRIEQEVDAALVAKGLAPDAQVEFSNHDLQLVIAANLSPTVAVSDLVFDPTNQRFTAIVEAPAGAANPARLSVAGRIRDVQEVPVLAHPMARGDVIATRDLTFARVRKDQVRRDALLDVDQIIGLTPKGTLRTGQVVTLADLQRPVAIQRGALVTIVLHQGAMTLTVQGRANEPGSVGDVIRVTNTNSNLVIPGRVDGPNEVSVGIGAPPAPAPHSGLALAN